MLEFECSFINNQKQNHSLVEFKSECGTVLVCSSWESEHATMFVHTMRKLNFQMDYVKHRNLCKICIFIISMCNLKFSVLKQININWITDYTAGSNRLIYLSLDFFPLWAEQCQCTQWEYRTVFMCTQLKLSYQLNFGGFIFITSAQNELF